MKLPPPNPPRSQHQGGFLVIAMLAIISIMLVYIAANLHVLAALKRDIRLVEQKQVLRLSKTFPVASGTTTNAVPTISPEQPSAQ